jgi:hypothetical protein
MSNTVYIISVIAVIIFSFAYFLLDKTFLKVAKVKKDKVSFESANLALDRIEKWTTWITGLQTAGLAAMGFLLKDNSNKKNLILPGFYALLFFGASIVLSTWLLSSLPSIQQRLVNSNKEHEDNDIYMAKIFSFVPYRMGRFTGLIHTYFLIGIIFFVFFIFRSLTS